MSIQRFWEQLLNGQKGCKNCESEYVTAPPAPVIDDYPLRKAQEDKLYQALCQRGRQILLYAPGGMGKTHMARKLFYRLHGMYKRMAWVNYGSSIRVSMTMPQLDNVSDNPDIRFAEFIRSLEEEPDTILFIDDAKESAVNDLVLAQLTGLGITILLTSRCAKIPPYESWELDTVTSRECTNLFYSHYQKDSKQKYRFAVERLANRMERNIFAMRLLASVAGEPAELPRMAEALEKGSLMEHIGQLMDFSGLVEDQRKILHCMSLMPSSEIPVGLLGWFAYPKAELTELMAKGWLTYNDKVDSLVLHDLVREYCNRKEPDHHVLRFFVEGALGKNFDRGAAHHTSATVKGKVLELQMQAISLMEKYWDSSEDLAHACNNMGIEFSKFGSYRNALEYYFKGLRIREGMLSSDHPDLATSYNNVGGMYCELGDYAKALEYQLKGLAIRERVLPSSHLDLATSYNNVSLTYVDLQDYAEALNYQLKGLAICEKVLSNDDCDLATAYNNVGGIYGELGDYTQALDYQLRGLTIREKMLSSDHPDVANSYNNVGGIYAELGDYTKALEYQLKCLAIYEKVLPSDHPDLAISCSNVGTTYSELGNHAKALIYKLRGLAIFEKALPPYHPDMAHASASLARTYDETGEYETAIKWAYKALDIAQHVFPEEHPDRKNYYRFVEALKQKTRK